MSIDPICLVHGERASKHDCLYCTLCFKPLTPAECMTDADGVQWDVCILCRNAELALASSTEIAG